METFLKITIDDEFEIIDNSDFVNRLRIYIQIAVNALEGRFALLLSNFNNELLSYIDLSPEAKTVLKDFGVIKFNKFYMYKGRDKHNYETGTDEPYRFVLSLSEKGYFFSVYFENYNKISVHSNKSNM